MQQSSATQNDNVGSGNEKLHKLRTETAEMLTWHQVEMDRQAEKFRKMLADNGLSGQMRNEFHRDAQHLRQHMNEMSFHEKYFVQCAERTKT